MLRRGGDNRVVDPFGRLKTDAIFTVSSDLNLFSVIKIEKQFSFSNFRVKKKGGKKRKTKIIRK